MALVASIGMPLAVLTAIYTAYLFAQARARDLWQSALLPAHLAVQAVLAGAAALAPVALVVERHAVATLLAVIAAASAMHVLLVVGEMTLPHATAHARLAASEITEGAYQAYFRAGLALSAVGMFAPWIGVAAFGPALAGLLIYEHAYVQGAQRVPIA